VIDAGPGDEVLIGPSGFELLLGGPGDSIVMQDRRRGRE
jgi:hypothetical protein